MTSPDSEDMKRLTGEPEYDVVVGGETASKIALALFRQLINAKADPQYAHEQALVEYEELVEEYATKGQQTLDPGYLARALVAFQAAVGMELVAYQSGVGVPISWDVLGDPNKSNIFNGEKSEYGFPIPEDHNFEKGLPDIADPVLNRGEVYSKEYAGSYQPTVPGSNVGLGALLNQPIPEEFASEAAAAQSDFEAPERNRAEADYFLTLLENDARAAKNIRGKDDAKIARSAYYDDTSSSPADNTSTLTESSTLGNVADPISFPEFVEQYAYDIDKFNAWKAEHQGGFGNITDPVNRYLEGQLGQIEMGGPGIDNVGNVLSRLFTETEQQKAQRDAEWEQWKNFASKPVDVAKDVYGAGGQALNFLADEAAGQWKNFKDLGGFFGNLLSPSASEEEAEDFAERFRRSELIPNEYWAGP